MARRTTTSGADRRAHDLADPAPIIRSDVLRNRRALLQAARELFATGADVPMYEIGRRAGVGQATLYRHFPDRSSVVAAVAEELIAELEAEAIEIGRGPDSLVALLHRLVYTVARSKGLMAVVQEASSEQGPLTHLADRLLALLAIPLADAKAAGTIRDTFDLQDNLLIVGMVQGALERSAADPEELVATADRALNVVLQGILAPSGALPPGRPAGPKGKAQRKSAPQTGDTANRQAPRSRPANR